HPGRTEENQGRRSRSAAGPADPAELPGECRCPQAPGGIGQETVRDEQEGIMTSVSTSTATIETLADLLEQLGGIAPERVRFRPAPGTATEKDVLAIHDHEGRLYELVHGVLVEKAVGLRESLLAIALASLLRGFVRPRNLGLVTGADGMMRLFPGLM